MKPFAQPHVALVNLPSPHPTARRTRQFEAPWPSRAFASVPNAAIDGAFCCIPCLLNGLHNPLPAPLAPPPSLCPPTPLAGCSVVTAASGRKSGRVYGPNRVHLPRNPLRVNAFGEHGGCRPLQYRAQVRLLLLSMFVTRGCRPQSMRHMYHFFRLDTNPSMVSMKETRRPYENPSKR